MKHTRICLVVASIIVMGCCNFLIGRNLSDIVPCTNDISSDSLAEMSKESYMVPYVKYVMKKVIPRKAYGSWFYTFAYIDGDEIPEMIVRCDDFRIPQFVLSQSDGIVSSIEARHDVEYNEREGMLINSTGAQTETMTRVFRLENGSFELTAVWKRFDELDGEITYYFNDSKVNEETAERLLGEAFEYKETTLRIDDLEWMDLGELLKHKESIKGWK